MVLIGVGGEARGFGIVLELMWLPPISGLLVVMFREDFRLKLSFLGG